MKKIFICIAFLWTGLFGGMAQQCLPELTAFKIKNEAFRNSQLEDMAVWMTDFMGPRLVASKLYDRAVKLTMEKMKALGLENVRVEVAMDFLKGGWDNQRTYAAMTTPYYCNFAANPKAWTGSTPGPVKGEVVLLQVKKPKDIENYRGKLAGKIVLMPIVKEYKLTFEPTAKRYTEEELKTLEQDPRPQSRRRVTQLTTGGTNLLELMAKLLKTEKPAVIVHGAGNLNVPHSLGIGYKWGEPEPTPELVLPVEAHSRMVRLVERGTPVEMEIDIQNEFNNHLTVDNVIAEIPGKDPELKNEIVLIGGHLDSWHAGTGAADNASGCMVMLEALRILKALDIQPRRTIRVALWGGEEQGMMGSRGYVQKYIYDVKAKEKKDEFDRLVLYLNMDNGSGRFRGIYLQENDMAAPYFAAWMKPVEALGFTTLSPRNNYGTDHTSFDRFGIPAFQFIQDGLDYSTGYHRPTDTYERLVIDDLKYNAAMIAWFTLCAAMDDTRIPSKPVELR